MTENFLDPQLILEQCEIQSGSVAADFGCGSGFFSLPLAKLLGEDGVLYSVDVRKEALESVESKSKIEKVSNIITRRANLEIQNGSGINQESVDFVVLKDVLFQNNDKQALVAEAYRILKPEGKIIVVEWNENNLGIGPETEKRIAESSMKALVEKQNFAIEKKVDAGKFHYAMLLKKIG